MRTVIIPGFSAPNKTWAEEIQNQLSVSLSPEVIYWPHWQSGKNEEFLPLSESMKLVALTEKAEELNILAKSIGTLVVALYLERLENREKVKNIILCGVPLNDLSDEDKEHYRVFAQIAPEKILVVENLLDPHGNFSEVEEFFKNISGKINVIGKDGDTHEYYYTEDFSGFFKD